MLNVRIETKRQKTTTRCVVCTQYMLNTEMLAG